MSTEYQPFLGVGLMFDDMQGLTDFLSGYGLLEDIDIINDDLEDVAKHCGVHIEYFGMYNNYFVGFIVESDNIQNLAELLTTSEYRFESRFYFHHPELVHIVDTF